MATPRAAACRPRTSLGIVAAILIGASLPGCEFIDKTRGHPGGGDLSHAKYDPRHDPKSVRRVQALLGALGYRPGAADGVAGHRTVSQIRKYQKKHGLRVDGHISLALISDLQTRAGPARTKQVLDQISDESPVLSGKDLPAYDPWTTYVYSDGRAERVTGIRGSTVRWKSDNGTTFTAHHNFMLPWSSWSSAAERGRITVHGQLNALWPLAGGESVSFTTSVTVQRKLGAGATEQWAESWRCSNKGRKKVRVDTGTYDTVEFRCARRASAAVPAVVRTWYYAPNIRHYVRFVEEYPAQRNATRVDLIAIRPGAPEWPPFARAGLEQAVIQALATAKNGTRKVWTSAGVGMRVAIVPTSRFVQDDGRVCRGFVQTWSGKGYRRYYPAIACETGTGDWEIPGLEDNLDSALAISGGIS